MKFRNTGLMRSALLCLIFSITTLAYADEGTITTIAGNGTQGYCGDDVPAIDACMYWPSSIAIDENGHIFIGDYFNHRVRKINAVDGIISTVAGTGTPGDSGDGGLAIEAELNGPGFIALDSDGNLFISDVFNNRIRRVDADSNIITPHVGTGLFGFSGDGGPATDARLRYPIALTVGASGDLYFPDQFNNRIRRVDGATGIITTVAGSGTQGFCGDGGPAVNACLNRPHGVALDSAGNLYIADLNNYRIRRVDASTSVITTVAGNGDPWNSGDGGLAIDAGIGRPPAISFDAADNMFIASIPTDPDMFPGLPKHVVRRVDADSGIITTVAGTGVPGFSGDGGPATDAQLRFPMATAVDHDGNLLIADQENNRIRRVEGAVDTDIDGDGVLDDQDNCTTIANSDQRDTNGDGYGNACDPDINNDGVVNFLDVSQWVPFFNSATTGDEDFNGDGFANFLDFTLFGQFFLLPPGPSALAP